MLDSATGISSGFHNDEAGFAIRHAIGGDETTRGGVYSQVARLMPDHEGFAFWIHPTEGTLPCRVKFPNGNGSGKDALSTGDVVNKDGRGIGICRGSAGSVFPIRQQCALVSVTPISPLGTIGLDAFEFTPLSDITVLIDCRPSMRAGQVNDATIGVRHGSPARLGIPLVGVGKQIVTVFPCRRFVEAPRLGWHCC